jgi:hypothetical protein
MAIVFLGAQLLRFIPYLIVPAVDKPPGCSYSSSRISSLSSESFSDLSELVDELYSGEKF